MMDNLNLTKNSILFIISAPSGAGKTSLVRSICNRCDFIVPSISYTTRKKRDSEISDKDYYFITQEEFDQKVINNEFLESQKVYGNYYGVPKSQILDPTSNGNNVLLRVDVQGAMKIKSTIPEVISVSYTHLTLPTNREV